MRFPFGMRAEGDQGSIQAVAEWVRPALRPMEGESARWFAYNLDINDLDDEWEKLKPSDPLEAQYHCGFMSIYPGLRLAGEFEISGEGYSIAPFRLAKLIAKKWTDLTVYFYDSDDYGDVYSECRMQGDTEQLWNATQHACEDDDGNRVDWHYRISCRNGVIYDPPLVESEEAHRERLLSNGDDTAVSDAALLSEPREIEKQIEGESEEQVTRNCGP